MGLGGGQMGGSRAWCSDPGSGVVVGRVMMCVSRRFIIGVWRLTWGGMRCGCVVESCSIVCLFVCLFV